MPVGNSELIKTALLAQGAHTAEPSAVPVPPAIRPTRRKTCAIPGTHPPRSRRLAIQSNDQSDEINLLLNSSCTLREPHSPLEKHGKFQHVFRDGDRNARVRRSRCSPYSTFEALRGSERARRYNVAGATSVSVHLSVHETGQNTTFEQDANGKVRFFGGNLKAIRFRKKAPTYFIR